jgi:tetratricopeptide (TPR) repeat protein
MFAVALNYFNQKEYDKMKAVLRGYLKLFDSPSNQHYHEACFWVGWALENERKYREACDYYARAAEDRIVIYKPDAGVPRPPRDELKKRLSYDAQFSLLEPISGEFKEMSLSQFAQWVQLAARVDTRLDGSVIAVETKLNREPFHRLSGFDVLCETLDGLGLSFRVENTDAETAEKAYFRLASVYRKDSQMDQALDSCERLLERYPQSPRVRDVNKLKVDIYRGLKDYRQVLATLEELHRTATDEQEKRSLDNEVAAIYFDVADYPRAAEAFKSSLATCKEPAEAAKVRAAYARCLFRAGQYEESLSQYNELAKESAGSISSLINKLLVFYLKFRADQVAEREFPEDAMKLVLSYEKLSDAQRERLGSSDLVKVTWIYYVLGLTDLKKGRTDEAVAKFKAAANSPDDILAGEAGVRLAQTHIARREFAQARAALEYLLISVRSSESSESVVRATYLLADCFEKLNMPEKAAARLKDLVDRYPQSPYAEMARKHPLMQLKAPLAPRTGASAMPAP